jgi:hypothetical protein
LKHNRYKHKQFFKKQNTDYFLVYHTGMATLNNLYIFLCLMGIKGVATSLAGVYTALGWGCTNPDTLDVPHC